MKNYKKFLIIGFTALMIIISGSGVIFFFNKDGFDFGIINVTLIVILILISIFGAFILAKFFTRGRKTVEEKSVLSAKDFLLDFLKDAGMQPENDGKTIVFHYRGGHFRAQWLDRPVIRISYPCLFTTDVEQQNKLCRFINVINSNYPVVKLVASVNTTNNMLIVHAFADIYFTSANSSVKILDSLAEQFFDSQRELITGMRIPEVDVDVSTISVFKGFSLS